MRTLSISVLGVVLSACSAGGGPDPVGDADAAPREVVVLAQSPAARTIISALTAQLPAEPHAVATRFERRGNELSPRVDAGASPRVTVTLRAASSGAFQLVDVVGGVSIDVALVGARDVEPEASGGYLVRRGALPAGGHLVQAPTAEGIEDFAWFESGATTSELAYDVALGERAAGLRLVAGTLEVLDAGGAPRLRVAPPFVIDGSGARHEAQLSVSGCAYDADPRAPWGRPITPPRAGSCRVHVTFDASLPAPLLVDPLWTLTGYLATGRGLFFAGVLGSGRAIVVGGSGGLPVSTAEIFDLPSGTWGATGSLAVGRHSLVGAVLSGGTKLVIAGGTSGTGYVSSAEIYDAAAGTFSPAGNLSGPRTNHSASLLASGKVLFVGGSDGAAPVANVDVYDPVAGTLTPGAPMAVARQGHATAGLGTGKVIAIGGTTSTGDVSSAELYDPIANTWSPTGSMTEVRVSFRAITLGTGKVLVTGNFPISGSAELYDPATGLFTATGSMNLGRSSQTMLLLGTGKVLVTGGSNGVSTSSVELYDPTIGTFMGVGVMVFPRIFHGAVALPGGKVLVTGGSPAYAATEIFEQGGPGAACTYGWECLSNACDQGACCVAPCTGTCQRCAAGTGLCAAVTNADDVDTCPVGASSCDAAGLCKLKRGERCAAPSECATGFCADMACCDTACSGSCDQCNWGGNEGTCTPYPAGSPGFNPTCAGYLCDGTSVCPTTCASDADCESSHYCKYPGVCTPKKAVGGSCVQGAECMQTPCAICANGLCVDDFCCDTPCNDICWACSAAAKGSGVDGECAPAPPGTDPHNDCPADPGYPGSCKADGQCTGGGSCRASTPAGVSCGPTVCINDDQTVSTCNGAGLCMQTPSSCSPARCSGGNCTSGCITDADCAADAYCPPQGHCQKRKANASVCATPLECASGFCADHSCCDTACGGNCEACDVPSKLGVCTAVSGAPHGTRPACKNPGQPCGGACDGGNRATCTYAPTTTPCGTASCSIAQLTENTCSGQGECATGTPKSCPGNFACDGPVQCKMGCTADEHCAFGFHCKAGSCVPEGATCKDEHTVLENNGVETTCDPYRCAAGACKTDCTSTDDCIVGDVCDTSGKCVAPADKASADEGGCGCRMAPVKEPGGAVAAFAAIAVVLARRRRSAPGAKYLLHLA